MTIDASIPLRAGQAGLVNLADIYRQAQDREYRDKQLQMQERQMNLQEQQILARMSEQERAAAKEGIKDLAAAVQWAKTPEQWAQIQRHYAQFDPQIASISFDQRESALIRLGQLGSYLENTKPDIRAIEPGGSLFSVGPNGVEELVRANPGTAAPASPVGSVQEGATATNPQTGEKIVFRNGQWQPMGGTAGNGGGGFPSGQ